MIAQIQKASGKAFCRGNGCKWRTIIPKGAKCLRVIDCFYCEKCMVAIFDIFLKAINDSAKDVEDLDK